MTYPRAQWRPRVSVLGIVGGVVGAIGLVVLLQQSGKAYPTRTLLVLAVLVGAVMGVAMPSLGRFYAVRRWNAQYAVAPAPDVAVPVQSARAYRLPPQPTAAWRSPDANAAPERYLEPSLEVAVLERLGDWAHVQIPTGDDAWVDGRQLEQRAA